MEKIKEFLARPFVRGVAVGVAAMLLLTWLF